MRYQNGAGISHIKKPPVRHAPLLPSHGRKRLRLQAVSQIITAYSASW
ncbi:hypothetical protein HMPREF1548_04060 [Clostridium sp. KLE 1755]|nr:hypothetical protein HMPREF1548_04060 [Clostridium sp. KLE 1755]